MHPINGTGRLPEVGNNIDSRQFAWNFFLLLSSKCQAQKEKTMNRRSNKNIFFNSPNKVPGTYWERHEKKQEMTRKSIGFCYNKYNCKIFISG